MDKIKAFLTQKININSFKDVDVKRSIKLTICGALIIALMIQAIGCFCAPFYVSALEYDYSESRSIFQNYLPFSFTSNSINDFDNSSLQVYYEYNTINHSVSGYNLDLSYYVELVDDSLPALSIKFSDTDTRFVVARDDVREQWYYTEVESGSPTADWSVSIDAPSLVTSIIISANVLNYSGGVAFQEFLNVVNNFLGVTSYRPFVFDNPFAITLKAGTYRFNDMLNFDGLPTGYPLLSVYAEMDFTISGEFVADDIKYEYTFYFDEILIDRVPPNTPYVNYYYNRVVIGDQVQDFDAEEQTVYHDNWYAIFGDIPFDYQTITITNDTLVSIDFYNWYIANTNYNEVNAPSQVYDFTGETRIFNDELTLFNTSQATWNDAWGFNFEVLGVGTADYLHLSRDTRNWYTMSYSFDFEGSGGLTMIYRDTPPLDDGNGEWLGGKVNRKVITFLSNPEDPEFQQWLLDNTELYDDIDAAYQIGFNSGYNNGYEEGFSNKLIGDTLKGPIDALSALTIIEVQGVAITLGGVVMTAIALCLVLAFLKLYAGG